jgi:hypothetical protein
MEERRRESAEAATQSMEGEMLVEREMVGMSMRKRERKRERKRKKEKEREKEREKETE